MHSSESIPGRPASDRQGETVMIIALLLPSIWLQRTANVFPCVEVIPPERIIQNRGGLRDDKKLSRGESKIKPTSRADVTPPMILWGLPLQEPRGHTTNPCWKNAGSHFKHIWTPTQTLNMRGDMRVGTGLWKINPQESEASTGRSSHRARPIWATFSVARRPHTLKQSMLIVYYTWLQVFFPNTVWEWYKSGSPASTSHTQSLFWNSWQAQAGSITSC